MALAMQLTLLIACTDSGGFFIFLVLATLFLL